MNTASTSLARADSAIGILLKQWRAMRRLSQLDLALTADTSARHLSFIETGRAQPSRAMVLRLAEALEVPLRDRNDMLTAAGYTPHYRERPLSDESMEQVRKALDLMLAQHEPFPALVINGRYDLLMANQGAVGMMAALNLMGGDGPPNMLRTLFDPNGARGLIENWEEVARALLERSRREASRRGGDRAMEELTEELLNYPGVPKAWRAAPDRDAELPPILNVIFAHGDLRLSWFSTLATFGTPQDVTLQELHIEFFYPADDATENWARQAGTA